MAVLNKATLPIPAENNLNLNSDRISEQLPEDFSSPYGLIKKSEKTESSSAKYHNRSTRVVKFKSLSKIVKPIMNSSGQPRRIPDYKAYSKRTEFVPSRRTDQFGTNERHLKTCTKKIDTLIDEISSKHQVPVNLVRRLIELKSNYNHEAHSVTGEVGLMQLLPETAYLYGAVNPFDPAQNIEAGCRYLRRLLDRYNNSKTKALAAYNWGPARLDNRGYDQIPKETKRFVAKVLGFSIVKF